MIRLMARTTIPVLLLLAGCGLQAERGDYILAKEIRDGTPVIEVVRYITQQEASSKTLRDFLTNDDPDDVVIYHVPDKNLYDELAIGERVTVRSSGYTMLSAPPQAIATEITRYND